MNVFIFVLLLFCSSAFADHPLCKKNPAKLVQVKFKKKKLDLVSSDGSSFGFGDTIRIDKIDLNKDGKGDYLVHLGACGTGGCMNAVILNCGDNKNYYPVLEPAYYGDTTGFGVEVDGENLTKIGQKKWVQLKSTEYWQKDPYPIILGYRYQFDGHKYSLHFLQSEYLFLIKKLMDGKDFAADQLFETAYPRLKKNFKDPDLMPIRDKLMALSVLKKLSMYTYFKKQVMPKEALKLLGL